MRIAKDYYVQANPITHSSPRFPIWELILMFYIALYGVIGLFGPIESQVQDSILGPIAQAYSAVWVLVGAMGIAGMFFKIPTGFLIQLAAMLLMAISTTSIYVGLAFDTGEFLFRGSTFFGIFVFGSIFRSIQIMRQLFRLHKSVTAIVRSHEEKDD